MTRIEAYLTMTRIKAYLIKRTESAILIASSLNDDAKRQWVPESVCLYKKLGPKTKAGNQMTQTVSMDVESWFSKQEKLDKEPWDSIST